MKFEHKFTSKKRVFPGDIPNWVNIYARCESSVGRWSKAVYIR